MTRKREGGKRTEEQSKSKKKRLRKVVEEKRRRITFKELSNEKKTHEIHTNNQHDKMKSKQKAKKQ